MAFRLANINERAALVEGDSWYDLERASGRALGPDSMAAIAAHAALHDVAAGLKDLEPDGSVAEVSFGPPVPSPRNCLAIGLNYQTHADEAGLELPTVPLVFTKFPSCITGPDSDVELRTETGDYEVELVVVIGQGGRDIPADQAWDHVAGLTCGQDVSDRRLQFAAKPPQFALGKSRDTYGPIGPVVVSVDQFADPTQIDLGCTINGEQRQADNTRNMIFSVADLIAYLSSIMTLAPGDIIFSGTPEGVGGPKKIYLQPGDVIVSTIEGIGTMTNTCV